MRTAADIHDELLVLRCQSGEQAALPELVSRWHSRLYRHARRLVDQADAAEDVMQEAWLAIVRGMNRLNDPACFGLWAYRIVTNKCRDRIRERLRRREQRMNEGVIESVSAGDRSDADDTTAGRDGAIHTLRRAMQGLSPIHHAVRALHYLDGMGVEEIALAMNIPAGTVKSRLHNARERLRAIIEHHERMTL